MEIFDTILTEGFDLSGSNSLALMAIAMIVCQFIGKSIPDSATGVLGLIRKLCKVIGLYTSNRLAPGLTVADAATNPQGLFGLGKIAKQVAGELNLEELIAKEIAKQLLKLNPFKKKTPATTTSQTKA